MKLKPWQQILLALILAVIAGILVKRFCATETETSVEMNRAGEMLTGVFSYIGKIFMQLLYMIIVPLVFSSIVVGIARLGDTHGFGRLGLKTAGYYMMTSFFAIVIGLTLVNTLKPGLVDGKPNEEIKRAISENEADYSEAAAAKLEGKDTESLSAVRDFLLRLIPRNIFDALGQNGNMLALIFVGIVTGIGLIFVSDESRNPLLAFFEGLNELALLITNWVMVLAPIGVFGLVAATVSETGSAIFGLLGKYFLVVILALAIHMFVVMPAILILVARVSPRRHFYAMRNALLTAFSTSSSSATLPVTMRAVRQNAGVSERTTNFVLPLGATVNMDGTALYECVAVMFIAQVLGWPMDFGQQFIVVALALLTSIGVAGVPSASLVAIAIIVNNVGIPNAEAVIGFLLAVDRLLDMSRTAVNVFSDSCGAVVIARSEGEENLLVHPAGADG